MGVKPLTVAAVAAALLVVSVGMDIVFTRSLTIEMGPAGGPLQVVGHGLDSDPYARPIHSIEAIELNASDPVTIKLTLRNDHPWPTSGTYTVTHEGCWAGARTLGSVELSAPANGEATASLTTNASKLYESHPGAPKTVGGTTWAHVNVCRGDRHIAGGSLMIQEVPR